MLRRGSFPGVLVSMMFGRFLCMSYRVMSMPCGDFRMVSGLLVIPGLMMLRRLPMVLCRKVVMFRTAPAASRGRDEVAKMAEAYMRTSGTAIREMPIAERTPAANGFSCGQGCGQT